MTHGKSPFPTNINVQSKAIFLLFFCVPCEMKTSRIDIYFTKVAIGNGIFFVQLNSNLYFDVLRCRLIV